MRRNEHQSRPAMNQVKGNEVKIENGGVYRAHNMEDAIKQLYFGDHVELFFENRDLNIYSVKGYVYSTDGVLISPDGRHLMIDGEIQLLPVEMRVISLVKREPKWAGARVVADRVDSCWILQSDGEYLFAYQEGNEKYPAEKLEELNGPCRVVVDEAGNLAKDSYRDLLEYLQRLVT